MYYDGIAENYLYKHSILPLSNDHIYTKRARIGERVQSQATEGSFENKSIQWTWWLAPKGQNLTIFRALYQPKALMKRY
jgi:hypothetical protein